MKRHCADLVLGILLLAFAAAYYYLSFDIKIFEGAGATWMNSRTTPQLYALLLALLSFCLMGRTLYRIQMDRKKGLKDSDKTNISILYVLKEYYAVFCTFVLIVLYAVALKSVGFIIVSFIYLIVQILILVPSRKMNRKIVITAVLISLVTSVTIDWLFVTRFSVLLPKGILGF